jgi:hypothetical protein
MPLSAPDFEVFLRERRLALQVVQPRQKQSYRAVASLPRPYVRTSRKGPRA